MGITYSRVRTGRNEWANIAYNLVDDDGVLFEYPFEIIISNGRENPSEIYHLQHIAGDKQKDNYVFQLGNHKFRVYYESEYFDYNGDGELEYKEIISLLPANIDEKVDLPPRSILVSKWRPWGWSSFKDVIK